MTSLSRPDDGLVQGCSPRRFHCAGEASRSRRLHDDELGEPPLGLLNCRSAWRSCARPLRTSVDASRTSQMPSYPPFDVVDHAFGVGSLDLGSIFDYEYELSLVEQQGSASSRSW